MFGHAKSGVVYKLCEKSHSAGGAGDHSSLNSKKGSVREDEGCTSYVRFHLRLVKTFVIGRNGGTVIRSARGPALLSHCSQSRFRYTAVIAIVLTVDVSSIARGHFLRETRTNLDNSRCVAGRSSYVTRTYSDGKEIQSAMRYTIYRGII
jgi:hypothetical protein